MLHILSHWYQGIISDPAQTYSSMLSLSMNTFPEEPLALSGEEGGFFPARLGLLLNNGRYKVLRKLGKGRFSST